MDKFQHRLRTTLHTRSVENIMTRTHAFFQRARENKLSQPKIDNITTYLRKFEIDRENLNLAKRIMQCQSQHSRNKYAKEWKKTKKFLRVRSNFKPQLAASSPKIYKFQEIPGHGRLLVKIIFQNISSQMKQLNKQSLYLLKFNLGGTQLIANKQFLSLDRSNGYCCTFFAPYFLRDKHMTVKLIKVVQNNIFDAGKFVIDLVNDHMQQSHILSKTGKSCGNTVFSVSVQLMDKGRRDQYGNCSDLIGGSDNKENDVI